MKKRTKKSLIAFAAIIALCIGAVAIYASDYYRADAVAATAMDSDNHIAVEVCDDMAIFCPDEIKAGFIFYPGGKVEHTAYAPLMHKLAENDIACIVTKMPLNLAVLNVDAADKALEKIANVDKWYIGGHSLGGSMAASYLDSTENDFDGLILLASYSTADLSDNNVDVLSVYGSEDKVLNMEKYGEYFLNLPADTSEIVIDGGNHAQFGCYGKQDGDGEAVISDIEQQDITADAIAEFMGIEKK